MREKGERINVTTSFFEKISFYKPLEIKTVKRKRKQDRGRRKKGERERGK